VLLDHVLVEVTADRKGGVVAKGAPVNASLDLQVPLPEMATSVRHQREGPGAKETGDDVGVGANESVLNICNDMELSPGNCDDQLKKLPLLLPLRGDEIKISFFFGRNLTLLFNERETFIQGKMQ